MKFALVIASLGFFACATGASSTGASTKADARTDCSGAMQASTAERGSYVFVRPDPDSNNVTVFSADTAVCASTDTFGFGYRRVKLANGSEGYMQVNSLSN